jgi:predicted outer membrane repeat protein
MDALRAVRIPSLKLLCATLVLALSPKAQAHEGGGAEFLDRPLHETPSKAYRNESRAHATTALPVSNCNNYGTGSLRAALDDAVSGDVIDLTQLSCSVISLNQTALTVAVDDLTINGPGNSELTIEATYTDYPASSRIIKHTGIGLLTLSGLTVQKGRTVYPESRGGCIYSSGSVHLEDVVIYSCYTVANEANGYGGAIFTQGDLTLERSTVRRGSVMGDVVFGGGAFVGGNLSLDQSQFYENVAVDTANPAASTGAFGGAIVVRGNVTITSSTIYGNSAYSTLSPGYGNVGGVDINGDAASATITNSTISGNLSDNAIGGLYTNAPLAISNSTVAFNASANAGTAPYYGAGLSVYATNVVLESTIVAWNFAGNDPLDLAGTSAAATGSNNLIMASPISPRGTLTSDPMLQGLANNGGPTLTHALSAASPAIDAGNNLAALSFDQRGEGFPRVVGASTDIGAFEANDRIFSNGFDTLQLRVPRR